VAFLIAHLGKVAKIVHHLYYDNCTPLSTGTNDFLALHGQDVVAAPVLIPKESFKALIPDSTMPTWEQFAACTSAADVAALKPPSTAPKTFFKCFNLVALPAFLTKTLMQLDSLDPKVLDPKVLGLATIEAIREHATNHAVAG
jgi:hypothetical protein